MVLAESLAQPVALPLRYAGVSPLGLGTRNVESFTGYLVRLDNAFALPASILLTRSLNEVLPGGTAGAALPAHRCAERGGRGGTARRRRALAPDRRSGRVAESLAHLVLARAESNDVLKERG